MRSPIFRIYGFSQRAEGIPLTRSKQQRNLRELSELGLISKPQHLLGISIEDLPCRCRKRLSSETVEGIWYAFVSRCLYTDTLAWASKITGAK